MEFLPKDIDQYVEAHTSSENELLHRINRETHLEVLKPRMLSGHLQGRVLAMLSHMIWPASILEIGTYTGYSAICMAEGMKNEGKLVTIDINEELEARVRNYFQESGYHKQIEYLIGNALEIIPRRTETWDLVFIDADKENYLNYYNMVIKNVRKGGFIIADNVLWSGKISDSSKNDKDTVSLRNFNDTIHQDERVENVLFPVRDGLLVIRKK
mgnify:CR=1 FL=1